MHYRLAALVALAMMGRGTAPPLAVQSALAPTGSCESAWPRRWQNRSRLYAPYNTARERARRLRQDAARAA